MKSWRHRVDYRLIKWLDDIKKFFDVGCELLIADGTVVIKGVDYYSEDKLSHISVYREYEIRYWEDEGGFHIEPSLGQILSKIAEDKGCSGLPTHQT